MKRPRLVYAQVQAQLELLLEACSGRNIAGFVDATWRAVVRRLQQQERLQQDDTNDYGKGWEETKGDIALGLEVKGVITWNQGSATKVKDVAQAASSDRQLRVAGTFRRAIRASVRECKALLNPEEVTVSFSTS